MSTFRAVLFFILTYMVLLISLMALPREPAAPCFWDSAFKIECSPYAFGGRIMEHLLNVPVFYFVICPLILKSAFMTKSFGLLFFAVGVPYMLSLLLAMLYPVQVVAGFITKRLGKGKK